MRTVLIIEDDHETRVALREAFEQSGFCVFTTANGRDGLDVLPSLAQPLVVLLDQNMPIMSGDEFLRRKIQHPELATIPVIVMSAVCDRTHGLGTNGFMSKPLDVDTLIERVSSFFSKGSSWPSGGSGVGGGATFLNDIIAKPEKQAKLCIELLADPFLLGSLLPDSLNPVPRAT